MYSCVHPNDGCSYGMNRWATSNALAHARSKDFLSHLIKSQSKNSSIVSMDLKEIDCFFVAIAFALGDAHRFVHKMCAHAVH